MPSSLHNLPSAIFAAIVGILLGYLHFAPIIDVPVEPSVQWMVPYLKEIDSYLYNRGAHYVVPAVMLFILAIPNIALVALLVAIAMKLLRRPRTVFYSTLIWPALAYLGYWLDVLRLKVGAERLGLPSDIEHLPIDISFPTRAIGFLLMYSLYSLLVVLIFRLAVPTRHNPSINTDAAR